MKKYLLFLPIFLVFTGCNTQNNINYPASNSVESTNTGFYTLVEVASADTKEKCWSIIDNDVYDLTSYIDKHPNGPQDILDICGKDGTSLFESEHSNNRKVANILSQYKIGILKN